MIPTEAKECQHLHGEATVDFNKIVNAENQDVVLGREVYLSLHCKDCGQPFHFPHFPPVSKGKPGVNANGTVLRLPINPGPSELIWVMPDPESELEHN